MATKKEELANPNGCLGKAADDEPIFVLRAKDALAPLVVRMWAELAEYHGQPAENNAFTAKLEEARELANKMIMWQNEHIKVVKFPD